MSDDTPEPPSNSRWHAVLNGTSPMAKGMFQLAPEAIVLLAFLGFFAWLKGAEALAAGAAVRPLSLVGALLLVFIVSCYFCALARPWGALENSLALRLITGVAALALTWPYLTTHYNFRTESYYALDRVLILLFLIAFYFRPLAVIPLLLVTVPMIWTHDAGIGPFPWEFAGLPLRVLCLFFVWHAYTVCTGAPQSRPFFFLLLCIIAGHYWIPGNIKLRGGWLLENEVFYLLPSTYANGWLAFLQPDTITSITETVALFNFPMKAATILLECGCLFLLVGRKYTALPFLFLFPCFHIGVVFLSGICMWQWALIEITTAVVLLRYTQTAPLPSFTRGHLVASVVLIGLSPLWLNSARLAWFDTPVNYVLRFDAVAEDGTRQNLSPQFFAPYDMQFTFSGFRYAVTDQPLLPITWGATDKYTAKALIDAPDKTAIFTVEQEYGRLQHDPAATENLHLFLFNYVYHYNQNPNRMRRLPLISPPPALITFPRANGYTGNAPIKRVEVSHITSYYDRNTYREIRHLPLFTVDIPSAP